ncbi:MAG: hypothetical protein AAF602_21880 [Myxococcota bacterium]
MVFLTGLALQLSSADVEAREPTRCRPVDDDRAVARRQSGHRHRQVRCTGSTRRTTSARRGPPPRAHRSVQRRPVRRPVRQPVRQPVRRPPPRRVVTRPAPVRRQPDVVVRRPRRGPRYNRENTLALGFTGGSWLSGNSDAGVFADGGIGGFARLRPRGPLAAQLDLGHYFGVTRRPLLQQARQQTQVGASMMWFVAPQSPITPYVLGGGSFTHVSVQDQTFINEFPDRSNLFGLQAGGGLEIALGRSAILDFEARYTGYLGRASNDPLGTVTATVGIGTHF